MIRIIRSPLSFLAVRYPGSVALAWVVPSILSAIVVGLAALLKIDVPVTGDDGILKASISLFTVAGGFFVAALTVLITNDHDVLNAYFVGESKPKIRGEEEELTRKRFLSLLFGYLAFASFSIVVTCLLITVFADFLSSLPKTPFFVFGSYAAGFVGTFVAFQLFLLAMVGLHYLTDRLHRSDGRSKFSITPPSSE